VLRQPAGGHSGAAAQIERSPSNPIITLGKVQQSRRHNFSEIGHANGIVYRR
jgi:hypothetical protein